MLIVYKAQRETEQFTMYLSVILLSIFLSIIINYQVVVDITVLGCSKFLVGIL